MITIDIHHKLLEKAIKSAVFSATLIALFIGFALGGIISTVLLLDSIGDRDIKIEKLKEKIKE